MLRIRTGLLLLLCIICFAGFSIAPGINETGNPIGSEDEPGFILTEEDGQVSPSITELLGELIQKILYHRKNSMNITEMEALDMVKERYATNFVKVTEVGSNRYYYKLELADYYLVSEGTEDNRYYLVHLYEFVVDEVETGIGHTVTYGWYAVNRRNGEIEERMVY